MNHGLRLYGLGCDLEVRCTGTSAEVLAAAMSRAWSRCLNVDSPADALTAEPLEVRLDDEADLPHRLMVTTQDVTRALITTQIGRLLMFHAGAVSHPVTGESLIYVAAGGTGKTTLSRLLGKRLGYLTDETVGVTEDGEILPYPKPLSVRKPEDHGLKEERSPDELGLAYAPPRPRVGRVVLLDRQPTAKGSVTEELSFMDALFALAEQTSSLPALERPLHRLEAFIDLAGPVLRLGYREASDLEAQVARLIGAKP